MHSIYTAQELPTVDDVIKEFNSALIVSGGETAVPYQHDPISEGMPAFQGSAITNDFGGAKWFYAGGISTSQVVIIRDEKSGRTKLAYIDQFFKPDAVTELLAVFKIQDVTGVDVEASSFDSGSKDESPISVRIVINHDFFKKFGEDDFIAAYGCGIDSRLERLTKAFAGEGIKSEVLRLSSSTDLSDTFRKYLMHDSEYQDLSHEKLAGIFSRLSEDVTTGVCVNVETGETSWWSLPLTRVYAAKAAKVEEYYEMRDQEARTRFLEMILASRSV